MFFITITYPLQVSAPAGHLQVEYIYIYIYIYTYWLIPKELFFLQRIRCSSFVYQFYIYKLVFCFGDFYFGYFLSAVCMW
jgi:hypothetical protein